MAADCNEPGPGRVPRDVTGEPVSGVAMDGFHSRTRVRGVNPIVYWLARAVLQPFFHLYFRLSRIGREHVPTDGPVIYCANHRSFLDPFVIGTIARRPMYYVAKSELFRYRIVAWFLSALGAFPVNRGQGDQDFARDRQGDPRARRLRADVRRGDPDPARRARAPQARRRPAGARDRRPGGARGDHRHRARAQGHPRPAAQGARPDRQPAALPARRARLAAARRRGHRPDLAQRDAAVGVARRPAAAPPRRGDRRRPVGHGGQRDARPRRAGGRPRPRARALAPRPRLLRHARRPAPRRGRRARRPDPQPRRRARPRARDGAAARHAARRLRGRAHARVGDRRALRPARSRRRRRLRGGRGRPAPSAARSRTRSRRRASTSPPPPT